MGKYRWYRAMWTFQSSPQPRVTTMRVTPSRRAAETKHRPAFLVNPVLMPMASG